MVFIYISFNSFIFESDGSRWRHQSHVVEVNKPAAVLFQREISVHIGQKLFFFYFICGVLGW